MISFLRRFLPVLVAGVMVAGLAGGCLGQDFLDAPLELDKFDHGWTVKVEPREPFSVGLVANPLYPEVPWTLVNSYGAAVQFERSEHITSGCTPTEENPCPPAEELEPFLPFTRFEFVGDALGDTPLEFRLEVDDRSLDLCAYRILVVDDACEGDVGIAANRCGLGPRDHDLDVPVYEHSGTRTFEAGDTFAVNLLANAVHPKAQWRVVELNPAVLTLLAVEQDEARTPGDWDTSDRTKPWQFLPLWRITFGATGLGESQLVLEAVMDGERIDVFEFTVSVVENP